MRDRTLTKNSNDSKSVTSTPRTTKSKNFNTKSLKSSKMTAEFISNRDRQFKLFYISKVRERYLQIYWLSMTCIGLYILLISLFESSEIRITQFLHENLKKNETKSNLTTNVFYRDDSYAPKISRIVISAINLIFCVLMTIKSAYDIKSAFITKSGNRGNIIFNDYNRIFNRGHHFSSYQDLSRNQSASILRHQMSEGVPIQIQNQGINSNFSKCQDYAMRSKTEFKKLPVLVKWMIKSQVFFNRYIKYIPYFYSFGLNLVFILSNNLPNSFDTVIFVWSTFAFYNTVDYVAWCHIISGILYILRIILDSIDYKNLQQSYFSEFSKQLLVEDILIPFVTIYVATIAKRIQDKHLSHYYDVISQEILENHKVQNTCNAYTKVLFNLIPDFVAKQYQLCPRQIRCRDEKQQFQKIHLSRFKDVSILYADIAGFTKMSANNTADYVVRTLHQLFMEFDKSAAENDCYRIKLLGDCYYCVSGIKKKESKSGHAHNCVKMAFSMIDTVNLVAKLVGLEGTLNMRIGVHTGTVHCGVIGVHRWQFDVWSNDVTIASIMESSGQPGRVQVTEVTAAALANRWRMTEREYDGPKGRYENIVKPNPNMQLEDLKTFWIEEELNDSSSDLLSAHNSSSKKMALPFHLANYGMTKPSKHMQLLGNSSQNRTDKFKISNNKDIRGGGVDPKTLTDNDLMQRTMLNNLTLENDIFINECKIPWDRSSIRLDYSFEFKKSSQEAQFSHVMTDMETFYNWNILKIFILLMITILVANWSFTIFSESKQPYQYFYHFLLLVCVFSILLVMICILDSTLLKKKEKLEDDDEGGVFDNDNDGLSDEKSEIASTITRTIFGFY